MLHRRRQTIDARGQHGLHGGRHLDGVQRLGQTEGAALAGDDAGFDQRADALLQEERVAFAALDQQALERLQGPAGAEQAVEEGRRPFRRQRIDP